MMSRHFQILALASGLMYPSFSPAIAETPLPVLTVTAEMSRLETEYVLVGEITAPETLQAAFPVGGRLTEVAVETGDVVTRGMELARIEQVQQVQAVASAEATWPPPRRNTPPPSTRPIARMNCLNAAQRPGPIAMPPMTGWPLRWPRGLRRRRRWIKPRRRWMTRC